MPNSVTAVPAAPAEAAAAHFAAGFAFETDCWDVREAIASGDPVSCCSTCAIRRFMPLGTSPGRSVCRTAKSSLRDYATGRRTRCSSPIVPVPTATVRRAAPCGWLGLAGR